jgi:hypothetical protein
MTLPAAASAVPGKTNHTYLVLADQSEHLGAAISLLGPRDDDRRVSVQMLHTAASSAGTVVVSGRVFDADLIATLNGDLGVPATLRATGDCGAPVAYSTTTDALGRYELTLGCAGTYTIETTALVPGYWTTSTTTLIVPATGLADADIGLAREKATLTVDVEFLSGAAANRVTVDPAGVDVASDPSAKEATGGTAVYTGIPWGTYTIAASAASGAGTPVPTTPVFLRPPGERAVVYVL